MLRPLLIIAFALSTSGLTLGCTAASDAAPPGASDGAETNDDNDMTSQTPITLKNWLNHPKVVEVRALVAEIDSGIAAQTLTLERKDNLCDRIGEASRERYADAKGAIRKLVFTAGSEHSYGTTTAYYGNDGKLRFVFDELSGDWGRARDVRVYFDAQGRESWQVIREANEGGPMGAPAPDLARYPYKTPSADDRLVVAPQIATDPARAFAGPPQCD